MDDGKSKRGAEEARNVRKALQSETAKCAHVSKILWRTCDLT